MKILIDSHVLIWWLDDDPRLGRRARRLMADDNEILTSVMSLIELAQKQRIEKISPKIDFVSKTLELGFFIADLDYAAALEYRHLPQLVWRDPFDHLLIAQALAHNLTLLSADKQILGAPIKRLKVLDASN